MIQVFKILNELVRKKIIEKYAIGGSIGVIFYTESINTKDLDIFITTPAIRSKKRIVHFGAVYEYLRQRGYKMEGQYFVIDGLPVDFIPGDSLSIEAVDHAATLAYNKIRVKVFRPEYLAAIALRTGRPQDLRKIDLLTSQTKMNKKLFTSILKRHGLYEKWEKYSKK